MRIEIFLMLLLTQQIIEGHEKILEVNLEDILIKEINEQPEIIQNIIDLELNNIISIAKKLSGKFKYVLIAARGSSDNAARYAQYVLGTYNHFQIALATPSIFTIYEEPPDLSESLVIGISQSGQSPDIVSVLKSAKQQNRPTLCITNDPKSPLAKTSDHIIPLHVGKEKAVAATKTYTSSLTALAMLSVGFNPDRKRQNSIQALPELLGESLPVFSRTAENAVRYRYMEHCVVIGRGYNYCTAFEIALKVKELTRVVAVPYSSADFAHGPIATVQTGFPIFVIAPTGPMYDHIEQFTNKLLGIGAEIISISDNKNMHSISKIGFPVPSEIPEWLSPIIYVIPGQLFARKLALEKGLDIDKPEGLSKVTETF